jgi:EmrB/QacA subfamily drug resistance transporter
MNKNMLLLTFGLSAFLTPFISSSTNLALPSIGREMSIDVVTLGWVATAFILAAAVFLVPFGRLSDIYGRRLIFLTGMILFTISSCLCGIAHTGHELITFRLLQGLSGSMIFGTSLAILTSVFPPEERGKAIGINSAAVYSGLSLGPFLGGIMTQAWGWRSIFWLNVGLGIVIIILTVIFLRGEWHEAKGEKFDLLGSALYAVSIGLLMFGSTKMHDRFGIFIMLAGLAAFIAFLILEGCIKQPVFDVNLLLKNKIFAFSSLSSLINYSATFAVGFLASLYLQYIKGMEPKQAGVILLSQPVFMAVFSPIAGRISDKKDARMVASFGMALTAASLMIMLFVTPGTSFLAIIVVLAFLGFGLAVFISPNTSAIMGSVERKYYGVASSTIGTVRLFGQMLSMGITMFVLSALVGKVKVTPEVHPQFMSSIKISLSVFAVLCVFGIFTSLAGRRKEKSGEVA